MSQTSPNPTPNQAFKPGSAASAAATATSAAAPVVPAGAASSETTTSQDRYEAIRALAEQAEERAKARQHAKGKLTAHERLDLLFDEDTFEELGQFHGGDLERGRVSCAVITGFGKIHGRVVGAYAQDFSIQGGTLGRAEGEKICALIDKAMDLKVPVVGLIDSGGARIQEGVVALTEYGRIFRRTCMASGFIPQISLILGPCAGGAVYCPALTDVIVMTKESSKMFVTGPDVVKAATGEEISMDDLGGGYVHNAVSGVAHYLAENEEDAIDYVRTLLVYLPSNATQKPPTYSYTPSRRDQEAARNVGSIVPENDRIPYDVVEVIRSLVDYGEFIQIHELFGTSAVIGFACIDGHPVGIVANQPKVLAGILDVDSSEKVARFVRMCDAFNLPILTLVDVPGYKPGSDQERAGIIRRGAKVIYAYAETSVPTITVTLRKAYGGAYIVMGSKSLGADINFAWPGAKMAVLGAEGAVNIIHRRELKAAQEAGENVAELRQKLIQDYEARTVNANLSLQTGQLDAMIDPSDTRREIEKALSLLKDKQKQQHVPKKHGNQPQ